MYIGDLVQGRARKPSYKSKKLVKQPRDKWIIVPNTHEPIIDKHVFFAVQEIRNQRVYEGCNGEGKAHVLTGKLQCASCGSSMNKYSMTYKGHTKYYLRCKQYSINRDSCTSHSIRLDRLEDEVCRQLRYCIDHYYDIRPPEEYLKDDTYTKKRASILQEIRGLNNKLALAKEAKRTVYSDKIAGVITAEDYVEFSQGYSNEIKRIEARLEVLESDLVVLESKKTDYEAVKRKIEQAVYFNKLTRQLVVEFLDHVEIGEKDPDTKEQEINIHWLF